MKDRAKLKVSSRIHFSFIDMEGSWSGRAFGGCGVSILEPNGEFVLNKSNNRIIITDNTALGLKEPELIDSIQKTLNRVQKYYQLGGISLDILKMIPPHMGLGSKTQTLISISKTYCELYDIKPELYTISKLAGRGGTSGVGITTAFEGGFVVDVGHTFKSQNFSFSSKPARNDYQPAPTIYRKNFPDWPIIIVMPIGRNIEGDLEIQLIKKATPIPLADVQACCHIILMMLIPSIIETDIKTFCKGINLIQKLSWKNFEINAHPLNVLNLMKLMENLGLDGVGLSSWGPALFGFGSILEDLERREEIVLTIKNRLKNDGGGTCFVTQINNQGPRVIFS